MPFTNAPYEKKRPSNAMIAPAPAPIVTPFLIAAPLLAEVVDVEVDVEEPVLV